MAVTVKQEGEALAPALLLTPSPSPPSLHCPLPSSDSLPVRPSAPASDVHGAWLKETHVAHARRVAEQVHLLHLAKAVFSSPSSRSSSPTASDASTDSSSSSTTPALRMSRYHFDVERVEGGEKVMKRVTVIIPGEQARARGKAPYFIPAQKLKAPSNLAFLPPQRPSTSSSSTRRRLSLPSLRTLSLLPPTPAPRLFRHALPPSPSRSPSSSSSPCAAAAVSITQLQRRRPALTLRHSNFRAFEEKLEKTKTRVSRERERMGSLREEEEEAEEEEGKEEGKTLGERRGKVVEPLRLV
ncbi:hypothetical protein JCM8547_008626 [Rhodosporidiobolus lusitaniae]